MHPSSIVKPPRRITAEYLNRVVGHYLNRYATTSAHMRRLLGKRVRRSAAHHGDSVAEGMALVDELIARLIRIGALNDEEWARAKAASLHRRGTGTRAIQVKLREKGLNAETIDLAIEALREGGGDPDRLAVWKYARKRALGPYRRVPGDDDRRRKELARLARAGFSYELAREVVEASEPPEP